MFDPNPGRTVFYNAYFNGTEVVVMGYRYEDPDQPGSFLTRSIAILVDEEVFDRLRLDEEAERYDRDGRPQPGQVV